MAERTPLSQRQSVKENEYMCHCYVRSDGLVGVCVSDEEYQTRVAHSLITKILDDFAGQGGIQEFNSSFSQVVRTAEYFIRISQKRARESNLKLELRETQTERERERERERVASWLNSPLKGYLILFENETRTSSTYCRCRAPNGRQGRRWRGSRAHSTSTSRSTRDVIRCCREISLQWNHIIYHSLDEKVA